MNDDLIRTLSIIADGLQDVSEQVREVIEHFAKAVSGAFDEMMRQVFDSEPPELPKKETLDAGQSARLQTKHGGVPEKSIPRTEERRIA